MGYLMKTVSEALTLYKQDLVIMYFLPNMPLGPDWLVQRERMTALRNHMTTWIEEHLLGSSWEPIAPDNWLIGDSFMIALKTDQAGFTKLSEHWKNEPHKPAITIAKYDSKKHSGDLENSSICEI